jgi:hypothetical protein
MIDLYVSGRTFEELQEWCYAHNLKTAEIIMQAVDGGLWYNCQFADEELAIEFRLAFDAELGIKKSLMDEMADVLAAEIAKEIDNEILQQIMKLAK